MPDVSVTMPGRRNRMKMSAEDAYEVPEPGFRYENVFFVSKINASLRKCIFFPEVHFHRAKKCFSYFSSGGSRSSASRRTSARALSERNL